ncbi:hypothetical protein BC938DRAFT_479296 [Jimgerdemannia flammicorona]|uniref:Uncharacterized protein n=1 Tax=Jimgerdemannia flammicorona TaxID=994334 RepID=A0A433QL55_9FUNG|nr:hypothetical protein BC938DRAFT_479296 [Jimgerdemannia flammicorona]
MMRPHGKVKAAPSRLSLELTSREAALAYFLHVKKLLVRDPHQIRHQRHQPGVHVHQVRDELVVARVTVFQARDPVPCAPEELVKWWKEQQGLVYPGRWHPGERRELYQSKPSPELFRHTPKMQCSLSCGILMSPTPRASMPSKRSSGYSTDLLPNVPDFHHRQLHGDAQRPKFDLNQRYTIAVVKHEPVLNSLVLKLNRRAESRCTRTCGITDR